MIRFIHYTRLISGGCGAVRATAAGSSTTAPCWGKAGRAGRARCLVGDVVEVFDEGAERVAVRCDQHPLPRLLAGGRRQPPSRTARVWLCECKAILGPGRALMAGSQVPLYHGRKRSTVSLRHSVTGIYRTRTGGRSAPRSTRRRRRAQRGRRADAPPPPSRTNWTRLVPSPVLTGHVSSLLPPTTHCVAGSSQAGRVRRCVYRRGRRAAPSSASPRGVAASVCGGSTRLQLPV